MKKSLFFTLLGMLLLLVSCRVDDLTDAEIVSGEAEFAIPLGTAKTTIEDLLENFDDVTFIEITPDGVVHLRYKGDVLTQRAEEFLQQASDSIPPFLPILSTNFPLPFSSPEQLEVDLAIYKTGRVSLAVVSDDYNGVIDLTVRMPQVKKNGVPFSINTQFESPTPSPFYFPPEFVDMAGYELKPLNDTLYLQYEAYTEEGDQIELPTLALINQNIYFSYIEGYLGNFKHNGARDTVQIDFFENWIQGDVYFEMPEIFIHIENSFGVPTRSVIQLFDILTADDQRIPLQSDFIDDDNGIDFVFPENPGDVENMTFAFNEGNSNIEEVLGSKPIALDYDVDARMNPDTLVDLRGFITDSSYYNIQVEVDLPLHGRASGFGAIDEFEIDFQDYSDVLEAEFKIISENDMPLEVSGQAYFTDGNGLIIDSLFEAGPVNMVGAAAVNAGGNVVSRTTQTTYANIDGDRFDKIRSSKKLSLEVFFSTSNEGQQSVKALKGQEVEIRMGLKLKTK